MEEVKSTEPTTTTKSLKKKNHFFSIYIHKVLNNVNANACLTANAKLQINSVLCVLARELSRVSLILTEFCGKRTITVNEVEHAVKTVFSGEMARLSIVEGRKAVDNFQKYKRRRKSSLDKMDPNVSIKLKNVSRQGKASIIFPPAITEKFLRMNGYLDVLISSAAPIYLASVLEYICAEMVLLGADRAIENKRTRITVRDLEMVVRTDKEMDALFTSLNMRFIGGGMVPCANDNLTNKDSIKEMKLLQESTALVISKLTFERKVREILSSLGSEHVKISKDVFIVLQYFFETYLVELLQRSNELALHSSRMKVSVDDIEFMKRFIV